MSGYNMSDDDIERLAAQCFCDQDYGDNEDEHRGNCPANPDYEPSDDDLARYLNPEARGWH